VPSANTPNFTNGLDRARVALTALSSAETPVVGSTRREPAIPRLLMFVRSPRRVLQDMRLGLTGQNQASRNRSFEFMPHPQHPDGLSGQPRAHPRFCRVFESLHEAHQKVWAVCDATVGHAFFVLAKIPTNVGPCRSHFGKN
jgi:hypothetical protein